MYKVYVRVKSDREFEDSGWTANVTLPIKKIP